MSKPFVYFHLDQNRKLVLFSTFFKEYMIFFTSYFFPTAFNVYAVYVKMKKRISEKKTMDKYKFKRKRATIFYTNPMYKTRLGKAVVGGGAQP